MARFVLLLTAFLFLLSAVHAQDSLTGRIYENKKKIALPGIIVQNLNTHRTVISDLTGGFSIPAKVGDLVVFSNFSYRPDTLYVKDLKYIEILLDLKSNMLKGVTVTESETKLGNLKAKPKLSPIGSQALQYTTNDTGQIIGGITANIFDSHSDAKKRNKIARLERDDRIMAQIDTVFTAENLKNYLPITGQELDNFIQLYKPDVKTFTAPAFNLTIYLNAKYKEFLKIPVEKRRSKLDAEIK